MACTINNVTVVGNWLLNNTKGIRGFLRRQHRRFRQHRNRALHRSTASVNSGAPPDEMNRTPTASSPWLVMDAFKLTPANPASSTRATPSFPLSTTRSPPAASIQPARRRLAGIWSAFARFGMGPAAHSSGAQLNGIVADYTVSPANWRWCANAKACSSMDTPPRQMFGRRRCEAPAALLASNNWTDAPGQNNWRWCHKCEGMYFGGHVTRVCAAGGFHDHTGSGCKMIFNAGIVRSVNWHWCHKCELMHFSGSATGLSAGVAENTGSGEYTLIILSGKARSQPLLPALRAFRFHVPPGVTLYSRRNLL
jgi:hypothetical protein